jgi:hypothetical protein
VKEENNVSKESDLVGRITKETFEDTLTAGRVNHQCKGWLPGTTATGPVPSMSQPIMQDDIIHGSCGNCGGPVVTSRVWMGVQRQVPSCNDCGATAKSDYGPTLPMNPREEA